MISWWISVLVLLNTFMFQTNGANILGLFSTPSKSHVIIHKSLMQELAGNGHNITVVTSFPSKKPFPPNYREILIHADSVKTLENPIFSNLLKHAENETFQSATMFNYMKTIINRGEDFINDSAFKSLYNETFDLLILGYMFNDYQLGVAAHFHCPIVIVSTIKSSVVFRQFIGNSDGIAHTSSPFLNFKGEMTFGKRVINFITVLLEHVLTWMVNYFVHEPIYERNFPSDRYPSLENVKKNISLVLVNYHFSQGSVEAYLPGMVEVGGMHIGRDTTELSVDIKTFLDNATDGAIFFSLGTNIKSSQLSDDKLNAILQGFSKLPQKVLWKWENNHLPNKPSNVMISKWFPSQGKILAHPNVQLFISHCGLSSVNEAMYYGVPLLGMPIFGDQGTNCKTIETDGWAKVLALSELNEKNFHETLQTMLNDKKYENVIQNVSGLYRDRQQSAMDTAVYWVEYVIRHKGAKHMQSPAVYLNFFQYHSLDVIGVLAIVLYMICKCVQIGFRYIVKKM